MSFYIRETLLNGDCFYSSIYRGALEHEKKGLLERIYRIFNSKHVPGQPVPGEGEFIFTVRSKIADALAGGIFLAIKAYNINDIKTRSNILTETGRASQIAETHTLFEDIFINEANFNAWLQESPTQVQSFIKNRSEFIKRYPNLAAEKAFYSDISALLRPVPGSRSGVYSSEIDIQIMTYVLLINKIHLIRLTGSQVPTGSFTNTGEPILWIYKPPIVSNVEHYTYFSKVAPPAARAAPSTAKTLAQQKVQELVDMGFSQEASQKALTNTKGNMQSAIDKLLSQSQAHASSEKAKPSPTHGKPKQLKGGCGCMLSKRK